MSLLPPGSFPVDAILAEVRAALARAPNLVVQAPPGASIWTLTVPTADPIHRRAALRLS